LLKRSFIGWGVSSLEIDAIFHGHLNKLKFKHIRVQDVTSLIYRSSKRLFLLIFPALSAHLVGVILKRRGRIEHSNMVSALTQFISLKKGLWKSKIFYAEK